MFKWVRKLVRALLGLKIRGGGGAGTPLLV